MTQIGFAICAQLKSYIISDIISPKGKISPKWLQDLNRINAFCSALQTTRSHNTTENFVRILNPESGILLIYRFLSLDKQ